MEVVRGPMLRIALLAAVLGGCDLGTVGGTAITDGGGSADADGAGAASFTSMIAPLITAKGCTVGGTCHMVQTPKLDSFANLQTSEALYQAQGGKYLKKPGSASLLVTKGPHQTLTVFFDATEKATIATWIDSL